MMHRRQAVQPRRAQGIPKVRDERRECVIAPSGSFPWKDYTGSGKPLHRSRPRFILIVHTLAGPQLERLAMADSSRMQKLLQQKAQLEERLKRQQAIEAEKERKRDTRRKVIRGAVCEEYASPELAVQIDALMKQHVKERDRYLFPEYFPPANDQAGGRTLTEEFQAQDTT